MMAVAMATLGYTHYLDVMEISVKNIYKTQFFFVKGIHQDRQRAPEFRFSDKFILMKRRDSLAEETSRQVFFFISCC